MEPVYSLLRDPVEGDLPQFLVMEVQLPGIVSLCLAQYIPLKEIIDTYPRIPTGVFKTDMS